MSSQLLRSVLAGLASLAIQLAAAIVGLVATAATATAVSSPGFFLGAGLAVYLATAAGLVCLVTRKTPSGRKQHWLLATGGLTLVSVGLFSITVLQPVEDPRSPPTSVDGLQWWVLSDGARIAYTHTAPDRQSQRDPIVFLHGGPGVADLNGDTAYFGRLAADGHDVYVYDQLGSGRSSRLPDPSSYTLDRWVTDLEEIRGHVDTDQMILVGHSWGARIAVRYLEQHPSHVSHLILSSPGAMPGSDDISGAELVNSLPEDDRKHVLSLVTHPRMLASYGLLQVNPEASRKFTPDAEMDARFDRVYNVSRPAFHCAGKSSGPKLHGLGFYANQHPQSRQSPVDPDVRRETSGHPVATLVIKGECDYLSWNSAIEYLEALPDATLVYIEDAGHNAYQDRPEAFLDSVRSFLDEDDIIPMERHDPTMPDGYQGPP